MVSSARTSLRVDRLRPLNVPRRVEVRFDESRTVRQSDSGNRRTDGQTDRRTGEPRRWGAGRNDALAARSGSESTKTDLGSVDSRTDRQSNRLASEANRALCPSGKDIPIAIDYNGSIRPIEAVLEIWRVDDEWWRDQIARRYIEVVLEGGKHVVLFEDLLKGTWFVQEP